MQGSFIQGLTDEMAHHANQTAAYGEVLGGNVRRAQATTMDLGGSWRGAPYQSNVQGADNWGQAAQLKGQTQAQLQSDGGLQISNHYEQLGLNNLQSLGTVSMPTA